MLSASIGIEVVSIQMHKGAVGILGLRRENARDNIIVIYGRGKI